MCDIIRQCFGAAVSTFSRTFAVGVHGIECNGLDPWHDGSYPGVDARVVRQSGWAHSWPLLTTPICANLSRSDRLVDDEIMCIIFIIITFRSQEETGALQGLPGMSLFQCQQHRCEN